MRKPLLEISNWHVTVAGKQAVDGLNLQVYAGELHVIMGPNGSGKSSLALSLLNHPHYGRTKGALMLNGRDISTLSPDARARLGMFLALQNPSSIPGVSVGNFMREATRAQGQSTSIRAQLYSTLKKYGLAGSFAARAVNDGFSGGEKKRLELVQMQILQPKLVILDEIDSGLDIDGIGAVATGINAYRSAKRAILVITHYPHLAKLISPDFVHVMIAGKIVKSGDSKLAREIGESGFEKLIGAPV